MSTSRGKPRPKAYLSIGEYLRKAGAFKTVNLYYNDIISTHPSVALSDNGDDEEVDELAQGMIDAAKHGHLETLRFLAAKAQTGGEEGGLGTCIGERVASLMLHLAAELGHASIVHYLVEDLWVDVDAATQRSMTALHYAAKANRTAVVRELSRLGADLEARNDAGQVPAQLTKDRLLKRLFQQYLGGMGGTLVDRFVPPSVLRVVDYVAVMTVKLAPQLVAESDKLSDVKQASVSELWRFPIEDHEDTPMTDATNLAEICTQTCDRESGPLASYGTLLTDMSGARSFVWSKVLGVYQDAAQRGRARVHTSLGPSPSENIDGEAVTAGEMSARVVLVLARHPYTDAFGSICEHVAELILEETSKWGSLGDWPLDMAHERNAEIRFCLEHYATDLPLPLSSRAATHEVLGRELQYGDLHASHSSFPHLEEADLRCLASKLGPDNILLVLSCLLQEQSVLLLSDNVEDLAPVTSALLGLLFPLRWPHTLIPVLPASLVHYLEAPVPFLMGMQRRGLSRVGADLSCITMINLTTKKVVLPIRPITSVTTVPARTAANSKEPQRRPSRRDSASRSLAELPAAVKSRAESRIRRCIPLDLAPSSDRQSHQPRASTLYTPGIRVAMADLMVDLFGAYQTYRYVAGAQKRMVSEAPADHRKLIEAIFSTQLWVIFLEDLLADETQGADGGQSWEEQAQLFCACVERARHQGGKGAAGAVGESQSCQDVLYPSKDVEEQLSLLSVYPEPDSIAQEEGEEEGAVGRMDDNPTMAPASHAGTSPARKQAATPLGGSAGQAGASSAGTGGSPMAMAGELNLQEKTDEVLRSITTSFATVLGGLNKDNPKPAPSPTGPATSESSKAKTSAQDRFGGGSGGGGGGWDMFKPPTMADMKRRLEDIKVELSPPKPPARKEGGGSTGGFPWSKKDGTSVSPAKIKPADEEGALAKFEESWRGLRRRSADVVNEAVTKLKSALDDESDDDGALIGRNSGVGQGGGVKSRAGGERVRTAAAKVQAAARERDDAFWKPFGGHDGGHEGGDDDEPVPLPTADEVRQQRCEEDAKNKRGATSAKSQLDAYYGGSGGGR